MRSFHDRVISYMLVTATENDKLFLFLKQVLPAKSVHQPPFWADNSSHLRMHRLIANWIMIVAVAFISLGGIGIIVYSLVPVTSMEQSYYFENKFVTLGFGIAMFVLGFLILIGQCIYLCCCWSSRNPDGETTPIRP